MIRLEYGHDCRETMQAMPEASVHCVVTSPPYYNLRNYQTKPIRWPDGSRCSFGNEPTVALYVAHTVLIFREVWRVLHPSGTLWLNLGDSYASGKGSCANSFGNGRDGRTTGKNLKDAGVYPLDRGNQSDLRAQGVKSKDLYGVPWMVAFALRDDGWYLRSDSIWAKLNPMPESVTDRPTRSHEYLFLVTKNCRYFYDKLAAAEPSTTAGTRRNWRSVFVIATRPYPGAHFSTFPPALVEPCIRAGTSEHGCCSRCLAPWQRIVQKDADQGMHVQTTGKTNGIDDEQHRHKRLQRRRNAARAAGKPHDNPFPQTATIGWVPTCTCGAPVGMKPDDLVMIGTPTGQRVAKDPSFITGRAGMNRPRGDQEGHRPITRYEQRNYAAQLKASPHRTAMHRQAGQAFAHYLRTDANGARPIPDELLERWIARGWLVRVVVPAWKPKKPIPCTVLDPFAGSGTTLKVASDLGRDAIGIDLNRKYRKLASRRIGGAA